MTPSKDTTIEEFEKQLGDVAAKQWADLQKLALSAFLSGDRPEIVQMLNEDDFPNQVYRKMFLACRDHWRVFKNTDVFEINHAVSGKKWYEELGGLPWVLSNLVLPDSAMYHRGEVLRIVEMMKELQAHRELGSLQVLLEESGPGNIAQIISQLREKANAAEELLPRSTNLSVRDMAPLLKDRKVSKTATGFERMDAALDGGLLNGSMFVLAARPGCGKTTLALNIAAKVAGAKKLSLFVSLEMTREEIAERYIACYADTTPEEARKNAETILPFTDGDLLIDDTTRTLDALKSVVMRNSHVDVIIIDYLQLLSVPGMESSRTQEISHITREIKTLARDVEKPIILLSQLNRASERDRQNREPVLSDLLGSGTIEQDADYVSFLWNKNAKEQEKHGSEVDAFDDDLRDDEEVVPDIRWILRKNRFGPPDKSFVMDFNGPHYVFSHVPLGRKPGTSGKQSSDF